MPSITTTLYEPPYGTETPKTVMHVEIKNVHYIWQAFYNSDGSVWYTFTNNGIRSRSDKITEKEFLDSKEQVERLIKENGGVINTQTVYSKQEHKTG